MLLLDTHVWIWAALGDRRRLSRAARRALNAPGGRFAIAAISLKEAAWHLGRGRVRLDPGIDWGNWLSDAARAPGLEILPLTVDIAGESERIPEPFPADPADRLIAATARRHGLVLVTADEALLASGYVRTLW